MTTSACIETWVGDALSYGPPDCLGLAHGPTHRVTWFQHAPDIDAIAKAVAAGQAQ